MSLHTNRGGGSLSSVAGLMLIAGGILGSAWLLFGSVGGETQTQELHAERLGANDTALPLSARDVQSEVPVFADALETAASTGESRVSNPEVVERTVDYLKDVARSEGGSSVGPTLPRDGRVLWERFVIQLTLEST